MLPPGTRRRLRLAAPRLRAGRGDCTERASSRPLSPNLIAPLAFTPDFAQTGFRKSSLFYYPRLADACCTNTVLDTFRFTFVLPLVTKQLLSIKCLLNVDMSFLSFLPGPNWLSWALQNHQICSKKSRYIFTAHLILLQEIPYRFECQHLQNLKVALVESPPKSNTYK